jgi:hypothetical protein
MGWTIPYEPSCSAHRQDRSRSTSSSRTASFPFRIQPLDGLLALHERLTRMDPEVAPCLVSDTAGADFVRVIFDSDTGGAGGGWCAGAYAGGGAGAYAGCCTGGGGGAVCCAGTGACGGAAAAGSSTVMPKSVASPARPEE